MKNDFFKLKNINELILSGVTVSQSHQCAIAAKFP